jgi:metal-responsive CopG/Arc/MetJ family transcriptional regulator
MHIILAYLGGDFMRTTLNIPDELIRELHRFSNEKSKTKAISTAIKDYIRRKKIEHLLALHGKINIDYDWAKEEEKEIELEEKERKKNENG